MTSYIAIIADVVGSRELVDQERRALQEEIRSAIAHTNRRLDAVIASRFQITTGDEFQGLMKIVAPLPEVLWELSMRVTRADLRYGIGFGTLVLPLREVAIDIDGPALHHAREAIDVAKRKRYAGPVLRGFGEGPDRVFTGLFQLLGLPWSKWKPKTKEILRALKESGGVSTAAQRTNAPQSQVSVTKSRAGYDSYRLGEQALVELLKEWDDRHGRPTPTT